MGWQDHPTLRLFTAHVVVLLAITPAMALIVNYPPELGKALALMLTGVSLAVNMIVK